jgi:hypothetical protein
MLAKFWTDLDDTGVVVAEEGAEMFEQKDLPFDRFN